MNTHSSPKILIVDDNSSNLVALRKLLRRVDCEVIETSSGNTALSLCLDHDFALALLDVDMPEMNGYELAEYLKGEIATQHIPIIFVTATYEDLEHRLKGYGVGAVDYIQKPIEDFILLSKVSVFLELYINRQKLHLELARSEAMRIAANVSESRLSDSILNSPSPIMMHAEDGSVLMLSKSWTNISGYSLKDIPTTLIWANKAYKTRSSAEVLRHIKELYTLKKVQHDGVFEVTTYSGEIRYWDFQSQPLQGLPDGRRVVLSLATDITERMKADVELRIAATAFEAQEGIAVTDTDGNILRINKAFTAITGYTAEEIVGQKPQVLKSGQHKAEFYKNMWDSIHKTGSWAGEIWNRKKTGESYPEYLIITGVKNELGVISNYVATFNDISQSKRAEEEIRNLAFFDPLTQLPNRRLLQDRLQQAISSSARSAQIGALFFIDLDNFKTLNDTLGHDIGDILLQQVAQRLQLAVRDRDTVSRLGGDEFVVMLEGLGHDQSKAANLAETVGEKILTELNQSYQLAEHTYNNSPSIGITLFGNNNQTLDELLKQADIAMYQAKKSGRNALRFFDPKMQEAINTSVKLESELREALEKEQFHLFYQVQMDELQNPIGVESLIRWIHPERGIVAPADFISLAEEIGLIISLGHWVLETACTQLKLWQKNEATQNLFIAVNVSAKEFRQDNFIEQVKNTVLQKNINPKLLKLELTESLLLTDIEETIEIMTRLNEIGVSFSLDDFGTGYSSLQYIKRLPIEQLKIDQSFVRDITSDSSDKVIVRTIIAMAQSLSLNVIAEGVETDEQLKFLKDNGCLDYQGYLFGKPVPIEQFESWFKQNTMHRT